METRGRFEMRCEDYQGLCYMEGNNSAAGSSFFFSFLLCFSLTAELVAGSAKQPTNVHCCMGLPGICTSNFAHEVGVSDTRGPQYSTLK